MPIRNPQNIVSSIVISLLFIFAGCGNSTTNSDDGNKSTSFNSGSIAPGGII
ncbi:hypothetical protein [Fodinibius halophilus]|uniref:hypothetical protein n=1 Tax=Fodinibius halophilus TaxID=1736908 RepID=UPI001F0D7196|nr:hypothetical protein [Fodinibius halophilus]